MQQHSVPQNVTQYQFRLVGDMTLKQFLELLGGLIVAYLFFSSNLIFFIKWPLAGASLLLGFALAFFPIEDRPLDQWIINFIHSIYRPTRYIWKKSNKVPNIFTFEAHPIVERVTATKTVKAPSITDLQPKSVNDVSDDERQRLNVLDAMLAKAAPPTPPVNTPTTDHTDSIDKPTITVRKLKPFEEVSTIFQSAPRPLPSAKEALPSLDSDIPIPAAKNVPVSASPVAPETVPSPSPIESVIFTKPTVSPPVDRGPASIPDSIHLPSSPAIPNIVVGMVVDKDNKIVENAIVQIVNTDGVPARAIKTNTLGQFYTSTPLSAGTYTIETDKDGHTFPANKLIIENKIIAPLLIKAN